MAPWLSGYGGIYSRSGREFKSRPPRWRMQPWASCSNTCASITIHQAVIIWHPSKLHGNVTVGLASHYHASQTTVVFSFTGSRLWEMSTLRSSRARYTFIYHVSSQFSHFSNILRNYCLYRKRISRQHSQSTMSFGSHSVWSPCKILFLFLVLCALM